MEELKHAVNKPDLVNEHNLPGQPDYYQADDIRHKEQAPPDRDERYFLAN